jgi:hypothetical protein
MIVHIIVVAASAVIALAIVRILLLAQSTGSPKLPPPSQIGLPSGRLAPPSQVHAALTGKRPRRRGRS